MEDERAIAPKFSHADDALAAYLGEALVGREVLVVGSKTLARLLAERGVRVTRIVRRDAHKRGRRDDGVAVRVWPEGQHIDADCVVIADAGVFGDGMRERLRDAARWGDTMVVGLGRDRGLSYEEFYAILDELGLAPRMYGQAPFFGFALVDFAAAAEVATGAHQSEPVVFDASLVDEASVQPDRFLAVTGAPLSLSAHAIVQTPALQAEVREQAPTRTAVAVSTREAGPAPALQVELAAEAATLAARVQVLDEQLQKASADRERFQKLEMRLGEDVVRLEKTLAERAKELIEARQESERRATLVRDLSEQLRERVISVQADVAETHQVAEAPVVPDASVERALLEIAGLRRELTDCQESLVRAHAGRSEAELRLSHAESLLVDLQKAKSEGQSQAQGQTDDHAKALLELRSREVALESRLADLNAENSRLATLVDSQRDHTATSNAERERVQAEVATLRGELAGARLALEDARAAVAELLARPVAAAAAAPSLSHDAIARMQAEIAQSASRKIEVQTLRQEHRELEVRLAEAQEMLESARFDAAQDKQAFALRLAALETAGQRSAEAQRALEESRQIAQEAQAQREELARRLAQALETRVQLDEKVERMSQALASAKTLALRLGDVGGEDWSFDLVADLRTQLQEAQRGRRSPSLPPNVEALAKQNDRYRMVTSALGLELEALRRAVLLGDSDDATQRIDRLQTSLAGAET